MALLETLVVQIGPGTVIIAVSLVILSLVFFGLSRTPSGLPPGPFHWPVIGNLLDLAKDPRENWPLMREKYGDVFRLYMGSHLSVVLYSYDAIKEAFVKQGDVFSDRPNTFVFRTLAEGKGLIPASGELWKVQRKFSANVFRDLGMSKESMEEKINTEVAEILRLLESLKGEPLDLHDPISAAITNIIFSVLFGERFQVDDPEFVSVIQTFKVRSNLLGSTAILNVFPWLRHIPGDIANMKLLIETKRQIQSFVRELMEKRKRNYDFDSPENYVEAYLRKIKEERVTNDTTFTENQLCNVLGDFFFAGSETTSGTIEFLLVYLIKYPKMQTQIQAEVDEVVGTTRSPCLRDRSSMPFTEAFISETLRCSIILPMGVVHTASEPVDFRGYYIPKGTIIFPFLYGALRDKRVWGDDADEFRPTRFLNEAGQHEKPEAFIPFSIGRRTCLGDQLARMELFLFLVGMLQRFTFRLSDGATLPDLKGRLGITVYLPRFEVCATQRR